MKPFLLRLIVSFACIYKCWNDTDYRIRFVCVTNVIVFYKLNNKLHLRLQVGSQTRAYRVNNGDLDLAHLRFALNAY